MIEEDGPKRGLLLMAEPPHFIPRINQIVSLFRKYHPEIIWGNIIFQMICTG